VKGVFFLMRILSMVIMMVSLLTSHCLGSVQVYGVAAYVNQHVITVSEVLAASRVLQEKLRQDGAQSEANAIYQEVLNNLIDRKLILDAYEKQKEIQIPPVMIDERVEQIVRELFDDDRNAFLRALGEEGRSEANWRAGIREQVVVQAMRNLRVDSLVHVSPTEVRAYYNANAANYTRAASITYRMLVVNAPTDAEDDVISRVNAALAAGDAFADVTRRFSIDRFAEDGGVRGPLEPTALRAEIREALQAMETGEVKGPIALDAHMIWLQLESFTPAQRQPFAEAQDEIRDEIYSLRAKKIYGAWVNRLRDDAFVTVAVEEPF
jgi:parvulin-like peptidyl-prolyl isomerase